MLPAPGGTNNYEQSCFSDDVIDKAASQAAFEQFVYPVLLGTGKRLFREGIAPAAMRLLDSRSFASGAVLLKYQRASKPEYGNMAEPSR